MTDAFDPNAPREDSFLQARLQFEPQRSPFSVSVGPMQPESRGDKDRHLSACHRQVGAVVATSTSTGDSGRNERLNKSVKCASDRDVGECGGAGRGADLEPVVHADGVNAVRRIGRAG